MPVHEQEEPGQEDHDLRLREGSATLRKGAEKARIVALRLRERGHERGHEERGW